MVDIVCRQNLVKGEHGAVWLAGANLNAAGLGTDRREEVLATVLVCHERRLTGRQLDGCAGVTFGIDVEAVERAGERRERNLPFDCFAHVSVCLRNIHGFRLWIGCHCLVLRGGWCR